MCIRDSQYGGPQGELGAAIRYLNQRLTMPDDYGRSLLKMCIRDRYYF